MAKDCKPRPGDPFFTVNRIRKATAMNQDAETLAKLAIDDIIRHAKAAIQPHLDNIARLEAMKGAGAIVVSDPDKGDASTTIKIGPVGQSYRRQQLRRAADRYKAGAIDGDTLQRTVEWFLENGG